MKEEDPCIGKDDVVVSKDIWRVSEKYRDAASAILSGKAVEADFAVFKAARQFYTKAEPSVDYGFRDFVYDALALAKIYRVPVFEKSNPLRNVTVFLNLEDDEKVMKRHIERILKALHAAWYGNHLLDNATVGCMFWSADKNEKNGVVELHLHMGFKAPRRKGRWEALFWATFPIKEDSSEEKR